MGRLTEANEQGYWNVKGLPWKNIYEGQVITEETRQIIYGCLCKLKDYEDIGPSPEQLKKIDELFSEACKELGQLKQKVNDTGWIPCVEKLPDRNDSYLVTICSYDETASINYRSVDHGNSDGSLLHCGTKKPRTKKGEYIVAWMPLPEPYRPEEDK